LGLDQAKMSATAIRPISRPSIMTMTSWPGVRIVVDCNYGHGFLWNKVDFGRYSDLGIWNDVVVGVAQGVEKSRGLLFSNVSWRGSASG
jgi:hypothetical protein